MSVFGDILQAVQAKIDAESVPSLTSELRRRVYVDPDNDSLPLCVISPVSDRIRDRQFGGNVSVRYEVQVTLVDDANGLVNAGLLDYLDRREQIRDALDDVTNPALAAYTAAWDYEIDYNPAFMPDPSDRNYDYTFWLLRFTVNEART